MSSRLSRGMVVRGALALLLGLAVVVPAALAGPFHSMPGFRSDSQAAPFNLDPYPCPGQPGARQPQGQRSQDCPTVPTFSQHDSGGPQRPGPSAFGLQFNYDE